MVSVTEGTYYIEEKMKRYNEKEDIISTECISNSCHSNNFMMNQGINVKRVRIVTWPKCFSVVLKEPERKKKRQLIEDNRKKKEKLQSQNTSPPALKEKTLQIRQFILEAFHLAGPNHETSFSVSYFIIRLPSV